MHALRKYPHRTPFSLAPVLHTPPAASAHLLLRLQDKSFTSAIRCMAFDSNGRAWIGDEMGCIKVLALGAGAGGALQEVAVLRSQEMLAKVGRGACMRGMVAMITRQAGLMGGTDEGVGRSSPGKSTPVVPCRRSRAATAASSACTPPRPAPAA